MSRSTLFPKFAGFFLLGSSKFGNPEIIFKNDILNISRATHFVGKCHSAIAVTL